ncbi:MAG: methyltransferase domain-containing protein [Myxococcaceae bacterium]
MSVALARPTEAVKRWDACPVCADRTSSTWVAFEDLAFVRCLQCATVYKQFERAGLRAEDFYEQGYFHGRRSGRDKRFEHRVRKGCRQISGTFEFADLRSVLDVGCSMGYLVEAGRRLGLESAGVDVSSYAVDACRSRGLRAEVGTLESLPFEDGEFDLVILRHVLEHTPTPRAALDEVKRVLAPKGLVLIAVPDLRYWKGLLLRRTYRYFRPDDLGQQHYVYYRQTSLERLLTQVGFEVIAPSKAFFMRKKAQGNPVRWLAESLRFGVVALWQLLASILFMRRELYVIARMADASAAKER